jgi:hypothetical protein
MVSEGPFPGMGFAGRNPSAYSNAQGICVWAIRVFIAVYVRDLGVSGGCVQSIRWYTMDK